MPRPAAARAGDASQGPRQRIVFCDCVDCSDSFNEPITVTDEALAAAERVARQLPPPKAILLFGSGLMHSFSGSNSLDECPLPHLNAITREGCLGVLAGRKRTGDALTPGVHDISQLCEVYEEVTANQPTLPSLASRHQGMQVIAISHPGPAQDLLQSLGASLPTALQLPVPAAVSGAADQQAAMDGWPGQEHCLPQPIEYASSLINELGVLESSSGVDLLLVHVDVNALLLEGHEGAGGDAASVHDAACAGLQWLDGVASGLLRHQEVKEGVIITVIITQHAARGGAGAPSSSPSAVDTGKQLGLAVQQASALLEPGQMLDPNVYVVTPRDMAALMGIGGVQRLSLLGDDDEGLEPASLVPRPKQSWQFRGLKEVDVDKDALGLCARRLPGVIRRDRSEKISLQEAVSKCGNGAMLIDRLLPELAYKLGRAPKYGA